MNVHAEPGSENDSYRCVHDAWVHVFVQQWKQVCVRLYVELWGKYI